MAITRRGNYDSFQSTVSKAKRARKPFCFLDLPPELRNRIYDYTFTARGQNKHYSRIEGRTGTRNSQQKEIEYRIEEGEWLVADSSYKRVHVTAKTKPNMLALLQTCRQIYKEARTVPYHCNRLHFSRTRLLLDFVTNVRPEMIAATNRITLNFDWPFQGPDHGYLQALHLLPNLESLRLVCDIESGHHLQGPGHATYETITRLRGLTELEIIIVDEEGRGDDDDLSWEKERLQVIEGIWRRAVTRPKILTEL